MIFKYRVVQEKGGVYEPQRAMLYTFLWFKWWGDYETVFDDRPHHGKKGAKPPSLLQYDLGSAKEVIEYDKTRQQNPFKPKVVYES